MIPSDLTIRHAELSDVEALQGLYRQLVTDEHPDVAVMRDCLCTIINRQENGSIIVADLGGQIIGTCQIILYDNLIRAPQKKGIVDSVVVDEPYRGQGIGTRMVTWGVEELKQYNCKIISVSFGTNRDAAPRLYAKAGFSHFGTTFYIRHGD